jgi:hypothetical protein
MVSSLPRGSWSVRSNRRQGTGCLGGLKTIFNRSKNRHRTFLMAQKAVKALLLTGSFNCLSFTHKITAEADS